MRFLVGELKSHMPACPNKQTKFKRKKNWVSSEAALEKGTLRAKRVCGGPGLARGTALAGTHLRCLGRPAGELQEA